jgi:hypothetical protein
MVDRFQFPELTDQEVEAIREGMKNGRSITYLPPQKRASRMETIYMLAATVRDVLLIAFMIAVVLVGGYAVKHYNDTPAVPPSVEQPCLNAPAGTPGCGL